MFIEKWRFRGIGLRVPDKTFRKVPFRVFARVLPGFRFKQSGHELDEFGREFEGYRR